ncbi:MAG: OmpA family protein [Polyangiaceae bacterium]|jgi:outer membrane protein OmpA-like peptidoglycan-associated protein|nr:OmpA family protein [Polyangiaceae bacterium]
MKLLNAFVVTTVLASLTGCSSTVLYEGRNPIQITGETRPPRVSKRALKAMLKNQRIEIMEKVQFELDQAIIKSESFGLLDDVAQVMKENPQIKRVEIQGHASADGDDAHNMDLSDRRAKAVRDYLLAKGGIEASRLYAQGYGETRAIADNNTQEGREKNRRVEFHVQESQGAGIPAVPGATPIK